jgi:periplasmic protein TonB
MISRPWQIRSTCVLLASLLAACEHFAQFTATPPPAPPMPAATPAPAVTPPPPPVEAKPIQDLKTVPPVAAVAKPAPPSAPAAFKSIEEYKQALARHIFSSNTGRVVAGELQPLLRAVVVLQFQVDGNGSVRNVRTLRSPESGAERLARTSLERAGALPAPGPSVAQGGLVEVTETWLFNDDGKFHLRTLGPKQRSK